MMTRVVTGDRHLRYIRGELDLTHYHLTIYYKHTTSMDAKEVQQEEARMRKVAFIAVVVSTVAVVATVVTLPIVYGYVQSLQSHLQERTDECKVPHHLMNT